jgi:molybdopterin synthase sulfur carrier subunit
MRVKYFADIRNLSGVDEHEWTGAARTVRELLVQLSRRNGAAFEKRVFEGGQLSGAIILLVNGRNIEHLNGIDTALGPDDLVAIFPMVAGG